MGSAWVSAAKITRKALETKGRERRGWDSNPRYGYPYNGFEWERPKSQDGDFLFYAVRISLAAPFFVRPDAIRISALPRSQIISDHLSVPRHAGNSQRPTKLCQSMS